VRSERGRVSATSDEAALAQAVRRLGWRVYATHHPAEDVRLEQSVAAYRRASLIEQGFGRLQGGSLSLSPLCLHDEHRIVGLICLLTVALRVLVLMPLVGRRNLQQPGTTLTGISPGQPGRQTLRPTTEMLLRTLRGVTLSSMTVNGQSLLPLTPLNEVQQRILALLELPLETFSRIVTPLSNSEFHSRET
jgi:transposase